MKMERLNAIHHAAFTNSESRPLGFWIRASRTPISVKAWSKEAADITIAIVPNAAGANSLARIMFRTKRRLCSETLPTPSQAPPRKTRALSWSPPKSDSALSLSLPIAPEPFEIQLCFSTEVIESLLMRWNNSCLIGGRSESEFDVPQLSLG